MNPEKRIYPRNCNSTKPVNREPLRKITCALNNMTGCGLTFEQLIKEISK